MSMSIREDMKLPEDSVAEIGSAGIIGGKFVSISPCGGKTTTKRDRGKHRVSGNRRTTARRTTRAHLHRLDVRLEPGVECAGTPGLRRLGIGL